MPWATVYVDGELVGETPRGPWMLEAGVHRVRLVNCELAVERDLTPRPRCAYPFCSER
jgi:hypothetical protein